MLANYGGGHGLNLFAVCKFLNSFLCHKCVYQRKCVYQIKTYDLSSDLSSNFAKKQISDCDKTSIIVPSVPTEA